MPRTITAAALLRGDVVVVSPHLDDAALSLGAAIAAATRAGSNVTVLTVFGGDPESGEPVGMWDRTYGFATAAAAAQGRRVEDARACELLGAMPVWLTFGDMQYGAGADDDGIWSTVEPHLTGRDLVLIPGFPLEHPDHLHLTRLVLRMAGPDLALGLYVEQPYANLRVMGRGFTPGPLATAARIVVRTPGGRRLQDPGLPSAIADLVAEQPAWLAVKASRDDHRRKIEAIRAYETQVAGLGRWLTERIRAYEHGWGGEAVAPLARPLRHSTV